MAYSETDLVTFDFDIYFSDKIKLVHLTTAGGNIPFKLTHTEQYNSVITETISSSVLNLEIEINPIYKLLPNIDISSFIALARKGFYSYDKSNLSNFDDMTFHLVAKPKTNPGIDILTEKYKMYNLIQINREIPDTFENFDLSLFM